MKKTFSNEGIAGFYRGVTISCFGSIIAFSFYMSTYEYAKKRISEVKVINPSYSFFMNIQFSHIFYRDSLLKLLHVLFGCPLMSLNSGFKCSLSSIFINTMGQGMLSRRSTCQKEWQACTEYLYLDNLGIWGDSTLFRPI